MTESTTASAISFSVRLRMKRGLPRHLMIAFLPSGMLAMSTSTLASARTSLEALIVDRKLVTVERALAVARAPKLPIRK